MFSEIKAKLERMISSLMGKDKKTELYYLISESEKWIPSTEWYSYDDEMRIRIEYFRGSMQSDMREEIKRRFPQKYQVLEREQVNLPIIRKIILDKAKVFAARGEISIIDNNQQKVEDENFEVMKRQSRLLACLKQADQYTQLCHRSMFKPWWDSKNKHVKITVWSPNLVRIVPDPFKWWDCDASYAVLFQLPSLDGITDTNYRWEVWGQKNFDNAKTGDTVHYITDGTEDLELNSDNINPFIDPQTNLPIYPFVWWKDDDSLDLYTIGDDDLLTINRRSNSLLCDTINAIHYKAYGVWVHVMANGGEPLGVKTVDPSTVVDLPNGASLSNMDTNLPISELWEFVKSLNDAKAMLDGLPSSALRDESGAAESGYALKIRNKPLLEHRENMVEIYRPFVEESIRRMIIVHNYYSENKIKFDPDWRIAWTAGELELPTDHAEISTKYTAQIEANVATPIDWRMEEFGEDRKTAEEMVNANAEINKELRQSSSQPNPFAGFGTSLFPQKKQEEPEKEPEEKEINAG